MPLSPYANCPCGSGKQFKWCCQPYFGFVEKAILQEEKGQHSAADLTLDQLVQKYPQVPQAWGYRAEFLLTNGRIDEAETAVQKALDLDPNFAFGFWLRGLMRLNEGESLGALTLFRKTADLLHPRSNDLQSQVHARIAELEMAFNRPVAARAAADRALHFTPQLQELRTAVDNLFGDSSRLPNSARMAYSLRSAPVSKEAAWKAALVDAATGKLSDALKAYLTITAADPTESAAWYNLGLVHAWLGDNQQALDALNHSLDLETDEQLAAEAGALCEVLRCGRGLEQQADYVQHRALMVVRKGDAVGDFFNEWVNLRRLLVLHVDEKEHVFSGLILEPTPDLGENVGTPLTRLQSYVLINRGDLRLWSSNRSQLDQVVNEVRAGIGDGLTEPRFDTGPAAFGDVVAEFMLFPTREGADREIVDKKMRERAREFFEDTWLQRQLQSLGGLRPLEAAAHPTLKHRLPGVIRFMSECLAMSRTDDTKAKPIYDFDRLRRKLGLAVAPESASADIDFDMLNPAGLAALKTSALADGDLAQAFRTALRLDVPDLTSQFAREATTRASIADRYPYFNHLIVRAREEGTVQEVLAFLAEAEAADTATNGGQRSEDYALARGQTLARDGDTEGAGTVFREAMAKSPASLRLYAPAAEAMLSRRAGTRAREFAEQGLKLARAQNNRDAEQQFLELVAAANKSGG